MSIDADGPLTPHFIERWERASALKTHCGIARDVERLQGLADPGAMHIDESSEIKF